MRQNCRLVYSVQLAAPTQARQAGTSRPLPARCLCASAHTTLAHQPIPRKLPACASHTGTPPPCLLFSLFSCPFPCLARCLARAAPLRVTPSRHSVIIQVPPTSPCSGRPDPAPASPSVTLGYRAPLRKRREHRPPPPPSHPSPPGRPPPPLPPPQSRRSNSAAPLSHPPGQVD